MTISFWLFLIALVVVIIYWAAAELKDNRDWFDMLKQNSSTWNEGE